MSVAGGISLKQLRYFCAVARARSFSAAARSLHVSQPALGVQVRELENRLGVSLLARHARGVQPTLAGETFLARAEEALAAVMRAEDSVAGFRDRGLREVSLGVTPTIGRTLLEDLLRLSPDQGGSLRILLHEGLTSELLRLLGDGEIQAAFCYDPPGSGAYEAFELFQEDLVLVGRFEGRAAPCGSVMLAEIAAYPLALGARQDATRQVIERRAQASGVRLDIRAEIAPISLKREMLIRRGLFTIVPYGLFLPEISAGQLEVRRIDPPIVRTMSLAIGRAIGTDVGPALLHAARQAVATQAARGDLGWRLKPAGSAHFVRHSAE